MLYKSFIPFFALLAAVATQEIDFTKPNEPIVEDPYYGKVVGDLDEYAKSINGTENVKDPFSPDSRSGLRSSVSTVSRSSYYAAFAGATYCSDQSLNSWNCRHCNNVGRDNKLYRTLYDPRLKTRGIVTVNDKRKEIVVAFRGAVNAQNWISSLSFSKTRFPIANNAQVHLGFKDVTDGLQPQFNGALTALFKDAKYKDYNVVLSGHSLGGAIATLAAVYVKQVQKNLSWNRIQVYTYNSPRVGNAEFAYYYNNLPTTVTRVVNDNDLVPHVPPMLSGYRHVFTEMYIENGSTQICDTSYLEDPNCSNSNVPFLSPRPHHQVWNQYLGTDYC